ncbi:uncharacterized protein Dvar_23880 [Desulfosarcina variabilis str. Montpellier]|uniref:hypothetical protein n=1 Tax=Desulfosarcina variabilis TaxID=2300 RepID=UPI003AFA28E8
MRNMVMSLVFGLLIFIIVPPAFSQAPHAQPMSASTDGKTGNVMARWATSTFTLSAGYRLDNLSWNIAGNTEGANPNVLSELSWSGVTIYQLKLDNRTTIKNWIYLKGQLDYGVVASGDNQDSDYSGDNRTQEFSRSINSVDGKDVWDGSLGIGPRFSFLESTVVLCPMLGYAMAEQDFNIVDGYQVIATTPLADISTGPIEGLDSHYQTRWKGPWVGVELEFSTPFQKGPFRCLKVLFTGEYHWVDYSAEADWNLRSDLQHPVSFSHDADGKGVMLGTMLQFHTHRHWGIRFGMHMVDMTTDAGLDRVFHADGSVSETRLNEVNWQSFTFDVGLSYQF